MKPVTLTGPKRGGYAGTIPGLEPLAVVAEDSPGVGACLSDQISTGYRHLLLYSYTSWRFRVHNGRWSQWQDGPACSAALIQPGTMYQIDTRQGPTPSRHIWVILDSLGATPLAIAASRKEGYVLFIDSEGRLAASLLAMVDVVERKQKEAFWSLQIHARRLVRLLAETRAEGSDGVRLVDETVPVPDRLVGLVIDFLSRNLGNPIRLAQIARAVHASVSTVAHRYRAYAGEGPMQTLRRIRMVQAKILLLQGQRTADIATNLGFCDERYFSTQFKRSEGRSPRAFLARAKGNERHA